MRRGSSSAANGHARTRRATASETLTRGALDGGVVVAASVLAAIGLVMIYSTTAPLARGNPLPPHFLRHLVALAVPAQELPFYELPADIATRVRQLTGTAPLRLLAGIGSMNLQLRSAADAKWEQLDERAQCALARAGLRSRDEEVAIGAAVAATDNADWLDAAETKRAARP